jgi:FKBP-type peptidyl-prolyl cis-trans isomerase SlyD
MEITKDKVVSLTYVLRKDAVDGDLLEEVQNDRPLTFLFGGGSLLPKFEENIDGLNVGDNFSFDLKAEDAYGLINEDAIVNVPKAAFEINGKVDESLLKLGNTIPMQDNSGNRLNGIVIEITDDTVKMDFNHPLAGDHLFFSGKVESIREATEEEISHGHIHAGGGCGCDSGCGCDDGKGSNCGC